MKKYAIYLVSTRNTDPQNAEISEKMNAGARMAFLDKAILEEVQKGMDNMVTLENIDLGLDAGAAFPA